MLSLENALLFIGNKLLLNEANLNITGGARIGVVGRNGCGKSHLMQLLAGIISPDGGTRQVNENTTVLLVNQSLPDNDESPLVYLRSSDPDIKKAEEEMEKLTGDEFGDAYTRLTTLDEERYEKLAPEVLRGLGLTTEQMNAPMRELSGGLRMRINLAQALIRTPDVLLLDEPTNHLDLESTQWLIAYLKTYPKKSAVVMVSHNLSVLKEVTTSTLHMRQGELTLYAGDYASYRKQLKTREEKDIQKNAVLEKEIERHKKIYLKFRNLPAERAAQAIQQLKKAEKKEDQLVELVVEEPIITLDFGTPPEGRGLMISLKDVSFKYGSKLIFSKLDLSIQAGSRIGLIGQNGEGKSTLIKLLLGKLEEKTGDIQRSSYLRVGYFSQDVTEELTLDKSIYDEFSSKTGITTDAQIKSTLANFGFPHAKLATHIKHLSGGEKSRLMFCFICARNPNLIILDEPTNHLDVETREELAIAMNAYKGSIILVSHDADLHEATMTEFWLVKDGKVRVYDKGIQHYKTELQSSIDSILPASTQSSTPLLGNSSSKVGKQESQKESNSNGSASPFPFFQPPSKKTTSPGKKPSSTTPHKKGG
jgi:ATP-binding cassette subfamily F protein 3